jgi:tRNA(adenine34) deaminase
LNPDFDAKVEKQIARFRTLSWREIEDQTAHKRVAWLAENRPELKSATGVTPRQAYELLFFDYMGLSPHDLPVLSETDDEIIWQSRNPCPTLEACKALSLDTRIVCRAAFEKSTQAFLSWIDPQLRFLRSYELIQPHYDYCLESIVRIDFHTLMGIAIDEARNSLAEGNYGYGAVVCIGNTILSSAHDTARTQRDPVLHAEVNAIRAAVQVTDDSDLSGAVLVTTCEPCPMCSSLAVWANLTTIVYGASIQDTASRVKERILVDSREIVSKSYRMVEVIGGVRRADCLSLGQ